MAVDPVTGTSDPAATGGIYTTLPTRQPKQSLDGEAFMQLLVTQLRNQDPSSPMDTNQMIGQTTQLAMMEKLTSMDSTNTENFALQMRMAATNLVGHTVNYIDSKGDSQTGLATSVSFAGSVPLVTIGDKQVPLDAISGVVSPTSPADPPATPTTPTTPPADPSATA